MYPTLSEFFKQVFGLDIPLPIQTYGFFVAMAFITGIWVLTKEFKRKEKEGILKPVKKKVRVGEGPKTKDLVIAGIIGFALGYKLLYAVLEYTDFALNPQEFLLSAKGNFIGGILGAVIAIYMNYREKMKTKLDKPVWKEKQIFPHHQAGNLLVVAGIFGLAGAKLFDALEHFDSLIKDPIGTLVSFSGLAFLGGLIVGGIAVIWYAKLNNIKPLHMFDVAAVVMPIGYAIGRIGCQVAGDGCWGIENLEPQPEWLAWLPDWTWSYTYPHNVNRVGEVIQHCSGKYCKVLSTPVYPTPFYETLLNFGIFGILFSLRKKINIPGMLFSGYLILGGLERFFIEKIRVNIEYDIFGGVTQAEILSVFMIISGIAGIFLLIKYKDKLKDY